MIDITITRTLEQRIKFDNGLTINTKHLVNFTHEGRERRALIEISPRGIVRCLTQPQPEDMYSSWWKVKGDITKSDGGVIVWGSRDAELQELFSGEPVATISLK